MIFYFFLIVFAHILIGKMINSFKNDFFVIFTRIINGITMSSLINNKELEISFYIGSLLLAIEYLHKEKIVHRNIKPNNIMIILKG